MFIKSIKRLFIGLAVICLFGFLTNGCLSFRSNQKAVDARFEGYEQKPRLISMVIDKHTTSFAQIGDKNKPLLLFIHGSPGSWDNFISFMKADSLLKEYQMIAVDRPGFGYSDFGEPVISLKEQALLIAPLLDRTPYPKRTIIIGHSLGGPVAARIAMDFPDKVGGLVLVAASIDPALETQPWYRHLGRWPIIRNCYPKSIYTSNEEIFFLEGELEKLKPLWSQLKIPIHVIQGTKDILVPFENRDYAKSLIQPKYYSENVLEGENHFIPWNNPQSIVSGILLIKNKYQP